MSANPSKPLECDVGFSPGCWKELRGANCREEAWYRAGAYAGQALGAGGGKGGGQGGGDGYTCVATYETPTGAPGEDPFRAEGTAFDAVFGGGYFIGETMRCVMLNNANHVAHHIIAAWLNAGDPLITYSLSQANVIDLWNQWVADTTLRSAIREFLDATWA
jgi:hypothetical protein